VYWIPHHIKNAKPGNEDLLTEIEEIENLHRALFDKLVTHDLEVEVMHWLKVCSHFCCHMERVDHPGLMYNQEALKLPEDVLSRWMTRVVDRRRTGVSERGSRTAGMGSRKRKAEKVLTRYYYELFRSVFFVHE
jgi:hypothetical protein